MARWPAAVGRVSDFMRAAGAEARLEQLGEAVPDAAAAAGALGCGLDQVVASIVLVCEGSPVLALVPGQQRIDPAKVARAAGAERARVATPPEVAAATGFQPGRVPPFPLPGVRRVLVERTLLSRDVLWVCAGSDRHLVALAPLELVRLTRARAGDLVQESA